MQTLTINQPGLQYHTITVTAESTVEVVERDSGVNLWYSLIVDGRHYDLVMWKHTVGREEHLATIDRVVAMVQAAIAALRTPPPASEPTSEPTTTTESAVCGALERLAEENAQSARTARAEGVKEDARFFQRSANAYVKALQFYRAGLRPSPTERGGWLLPSQRAGEPPHLLRMDGDWTCTCAAGESMHWAKALIIGIEVALDDLDRYDDCGETAAGLGRRLAVARAACMEAA